PHHQLGLIETHIGLFDEAIAESRKAVELNPSNQLASFRVGVGLLYEGKYQEALDRFQKVPLDAQPSLVAYQDAWTMSYLGRVDEALQLTADFLKHDPESGGLVSSARAMLYALKNDGKNAQAEINAAIARRGHFIHFHHTAYNIASAYALLRK